MDLLRKTNPIHFLMKLSNDLILASGSPRRKELLTNLGLQFETRTVEFAEDFPEYKPELDKRIKRLVDLEIPFKDLWYFHPKMQCSHSLKSVLPSLVPKLNYQDLNIKDGLEAMLAYQKLIDTPNSPDENKALGQLVSYCERDTYALFEVCRALQKLAGL